MVRMWNSKLLNIIANYVNAKGILQPEFNGTSDYESNVPVETVAETVMITESCLFLKI